MRLAEHEDLPRLAMLYTDAKHYADQVGYIDWDAPFPEAILRGFIEQSELHCSDDNRGIQASVRLSDEANKEIWSSFLPARSLYVSKLATAASVHGTGYAEHVVLPYVLDVARHRLAESVRLDCLADNPGLIRYYTSLCFVSLGDVGFYSQRQQKDIFVTRFEMQV